MSTAKRLFSGSVALWLRMGITLVSQVLFVPLYLSYWDITTYGIWLAVQAAVMMLATLDHGHQNFLENEFYKLTRQTRQDFSLVLWSGTFMGALLGLLVVVIAACLLLSGLLDLLFGSSLLNNPALLTEAGTVLIVLCVVNMITASIGGIFVRALSAFGYYARMNWWGVWAGLLTTIAPVVAVCNGASLVGAGYTLGIATIAYNIPLFIDIFALLKIKEISYVKISPGVAWKNFMLSLVLSGKDLLENLRQQGARVILAPLAGAAGLAAFSTMRTGANIALQGLNTISGPMMPELMRYLFTKDQQRMEASFGTIWIVVIFLLAPVCPLIQVLVEPLYIAWTRGNLAFDPLLFAILTISVLVYAIAQPALAVIRGNNLLKPQILISTIAAIIAVSGMFFLVPVYGIIGAGVSLLVAEIAATVACRIVAQKWLNSNGLCWPKHVSAIALTSVIISGVTMIVMTYVPAFKWEVLIAGQIFLLWNCYRYWLSLPVIVMQHLKKLQSKIPFVNKFSWKQ